MIRWRWRKRKGITAADRAVHSSEQQREHIEAVRRRVDEVIRGQRDLLAEDYFAEAIRKALKDSR